MGTPGPPRTQSTRWAAGDWPGDYTTAELIETVRSIVATTDRPSKYARSLIREMADRLEHLESNA